MNSCSMSRGCPSGTSTSPRHLRPEKRSKQLLRDIFYNDACIDLFFPELVSFLKINYPNLKITKGELYAVVKRMLAGNVEIFPCDENCSKESIKVCTLFIADKTKNDVKEYYVNLLDSNEQSPISSPVISPGLHRPSASPKRVRFADDLTSQGSAATMPVSQMTSPTISIPSAMSAPSYVSPIQPEQTWNGSNMDPRASQWFPNNLGMEMNGLNQMNQSQQPQSQQISEQDFISSLNLKCVC